jgi:hypothetical protein
MRNSPVDEIDRSGGWKQQQEIDKDSEGKDLHRLITL